jgi:hypothetical protein
LGVSLHGRLRHVPERSDEQADNGMPGRECLRSSANELSRLPENDDWTAGNADEMHAAVEHLQDKLGR